MRRQWIPGAGLLATIAVAFYATVQLRGQVQTPTGDFTNAATAQVRQADGQIVLQGDFMPPVEEDGGLERRATLAPTGVDTDAAGEAEIEFTKTGAIERSGIHGDEPATGNDRHLRYRRNGHHLCDN